MSSRSQHELGRRVHPAAVVALILTVAAILIAVVSSRPDSSPAEQAPTTARVASELIEREPTGAALIDAVPWGRVELIESPTGATLALPTPRETPLLLELPAGEWRIALSHPDVEEQRTCELSVAAGARIDCLIEFERVSVDQYFREAGWWR